MWRSHNSSDICVLHEEELLQSGCLMCQCDVFRSCQSPSVWVAHACRNTEASLNGEYDSMTVHLV